MALVRSFGKSPNFLEAATQDTTQHHTFSFTPSPSSNHPPNQNHGSRTTEEEEQVFNPQEATEWTLKEEDSSEPHYSEALVRQFRGRIYIQSLTSPLSGIKKKPSHKITAVLVSLPASTTQRVAQKRPSPSSASTTQNLRAPTQQPTAPPMC
jgi:hypothetical protein